MNLNDKDAFQADALILLNKYYQNGSWADSATLKNELIPDCISLMKSYPDVAASIGTIGTFAVRGLKANESISFSNPDKGLISKLLTGSDTIHINSYSSLKNIYESVLRQKVDPT
jgi:hypothetical protein